MTDYANLEIRIKSTDAKKAEKSLDGLAKKGGKAEKSLDKMGKEAGQAARATDKLSASSKKAARATDGLSKSAKGVTGHLKGMVTAGIAIGAVTAVFKRVISATIEQEQAIAQLEARIISSGGAAELSVTQMTDFAASLQKVTTFGDEAIIAMQGVLLTFNNVKGEQFNHATEAILDMSIALKMDLASAAKMVGKALNDPATGLSRLSLAGVTFTQTQKDLVKSLVDTGQAAKAQEVILAELDKQMGGSAAAARDTLGGALTGLANVFGDLFEGGSSSTGQAISALGDLEDALGGPGMQGAFGSINGWILETVANLAQGSAGVINLVNTLSGLKSMLPGVFSQLDKLQKYTNAGGPSGFISLAVDVATKGVDQTMSDLFGTGENVAAARAEKEDFATIDREDIEMAREMHMESQSAQVKAEASAKKLTEETAKRTKATQDLFASQDKYFAANLAYTKKIASINELKGDLTDEQYQSALGHERELLDATRKRLDEAAKPRATGGGGGRKSSGGGGGVSAAPVATDSFIEQQDFELDALRDSLRTREEMIEDSYARQMEIAARAGEDRTELELELTRRRNAELTDLEMARVEMISHAGQDLFGSLADAAATFAGEQSEAYRVLFAASKAFAIAEAMIAMQVAISKALALGFPANIPHMAAAASAGASIISTITSTQYSGAYDKGGEIKAGEYGLVGEKGIEIVEGKARAVSGNSVSAISNDLRKSVSSTSSASSTTNSQSTNESTTGDADNSSAISTSKISSIFSTANKSTGDEITNISQNEAVVVGINGPEYIEGPVKVVGRDETQKFATEIANNATSNTASNEVNNVVNIGGSTSAVNSNIENAGAVNSNSAVSSISSVASNVRNNESLTANATTKNIGDSVSNVSSIFNSKLDGESISNISKIMNSYSYDGDNSEIGSGAINEGNKTTVNGGAISNIRNIRSSANSGSESSATSFINNAESNAINESNQSATNNVTSIFKEKKYAGAFDLGGTIPAGELGMVNEKGFELIEGPAKVTGREDTAKMFQQLTDAVNSLQQPSQNVRIINVQDESAEDYLGSDPGERKVMNILRRNRSAVRGMVA